jgi:hypothetical protein
VSRSTSNFVSDKGDGLKVYVEHGDFGSETMTFIHGIASDAWLGDIDVEPDHKDYHKKMNPTQRYWKKHKHPKRPDLHITKGRFRFIPPTSMCLLGPDPQYELKGEGRHQYEKLKTHPACACDRCRNYSRYQYHSSEWRGSQNFWEKVTDRIQVNV